MAPKVTLGMEPSVAKPLIASPAKKPSVLSVPALQIRMGLWLSYLRMQLAVLTLEGSSRSVRRNTTAYVPPLESAGERLPSVPPSAKAL